MNKLQKIVDLNNQSSGFIFEICFEFVYDANEEKNFKWITIALIILVSWLMRETSGQIPKPN